MSKMRDSLKRLMGRAKKHMETIYISVACTLIASGLALMAAVQNERVQVISGIAAIVGAILVLVSAIKTAKRENDERRKRNLEYQESLRQTTILQNILDELRRGRG